MELLFSFESLDEPETTFSSTLQLNLLILISKSSICDAFFIQRYFLLAHTNYKKIPQSPKINSKSFYLLTYNDTRNDVIIFLLVEVYKYVYMLFTFKKCKCLRY